MGATRTLTGGEVLKRAVRTLTICTVLMLTLTGCSAKSASHSTKRSAEYSTTIDAKAKAAPLKPLTAESSIAEILKFAQGSKDRWGSMYVEGHSGKQTNRFRVWIEKPGKYRMEQDGDAPSIKVSDGKKHWDYYPKLKRIRITENRPISAAEQARLDKMLEVEGAKEPTIMKTSEANVIGDPINDLINPAYFIRTEMELDATKVEKIGVATIAGRKALQLKVEFGKVKEDHWDVYVDANQGILLGLVIYPIANGPVDKRLIDKVVFDPHISRDLFTFSPPADTEPLEPQGPGPQVTRP